MKGEVLSHSAEGEEPFVSLGALAEEFAQGREVRIGIRGLCGDLAGDPTKAIEHEVFLQVGFCYYYTARQQFVAAPQPIGRVRPAIPLCYQQSREYRLPAAVNFCHIEKVNPLCACLVHDLERNGFVNLSPEGSATQTD